MSAVLVYDVETTGIVKFELPSEDPSQPRVVQLAAELFDDETGRVLQSLNAIILPDGWIVPDDVAAIHGISTDLAQSVGIAMDHILPVFVQMWGRADHRVAHNEAFDMRMIRIELFRHPGFGASVADQWKAAPAFCTQAKSTPILNLPPTERMLAAGRKHAKSPNLGEAYEFFTGRKLVDAHDAAVDVAACKAIYMAIKSGQRGPAKAGA